MNATVAWSYQLLAPEEQRVFRQLGSLPSRFPMEAAAAVCSDAASDDTTRAVAGLIERSLLLRTEGSPASGALYHMLETVRAYAQGELMASGERDLAMDGLARYCVATAATAEEKLIGLTQGEWLARVRDDLETFRSGLSWLIEHDRLSEACAIVWQLLFFWLIRGHTAEGLGSVRPAAGTAVAHACRPGRRDGRSRGDAVRAGRSRRRTPRLRGGAGRLEGRLNGRGACQKHPRPHRNRRWRSGHKKQSLQGHHLNRFGALNSAVGGR